MRRPTTTLPPTPTRHATSKPSKKRAVKKTRPEPRAVLKETPADRAECELPRRDAARSSVRDRVPRSCVCGTRSAAVGSCHSACSRSSAPARCRRSRRSTRRNKRSPRRAAPRGGTPGAHSRTRLRREAVSRPSSPAGVGASTGRDAYEGNLASLEIDRHADQRVYSTSVRTAQSVPKTCPQEPLTLVARRRSFPIPWI